MTTERWTDEMLDRLSSKVDSLTDNIGGLVSLAAQQQANFNLMQTQIITMQSQVTTMQGHVEEMQNEVRQIWRRLDADTNN